MLVNLQEVKGMILMQDNMNNSSFNTALKTLKSMDMDKFWLRVLKKINSKVDANDKIRTLSLSKASGKSLR